MIEPGVIVAALFCPLILAACFSIVSMEIREWRNHKKRGGK